VVDRRHPVQTIEGVAYDWGYALLLALIFLWLMRIPARIVACCLQWRQKWVNHQEQATELQNLMKQVESLQKDMARTAAVLIKHVLRVWWSEDTGTVVSEDERIINESF